MNELTRRDPSAAGIVRDGLGREIESRKEVAATALAAQAQAEVQAAYIIAWQRPRSWDDVRARLLRDCSRKGFAQDAFYSLPRRGLKKPGAITGRPGVVEGLSVRFVEAMLRTAGNTLTQTRTSYDDDFKRTVNVSVTDLESNTKHGRDITLEKTTERRDPTDRVVLATRTNSAGETVYIVQTTEDELLQKESALVSKRFRSEGLRILPADIKDDCIRKIAETALGAVAADPDSERKALADGFARVNVMPRDLAEYLGHDLGQTSPAELVDLRGLFVAVRDGEATWPEILAEKRAEHAPTADEGKPPARKTAAGAVLEKVRERNARARANPQAAGARGAAGSPAGEGTSPLPSTAGAPPHAASHPGGKREREPGEEG